ncbi:MAG: hypothetical protein ACI8TP_003768 [Acidimicrobiales bacterium]
MRLLTVLLALALTASACGSLDATEIQAAAGVPERLAARGQLLDGSSPTTALDEAEEFELRPPATTPTDPEQAGDSGLLTESTEISSSPFSETVPDGFPGNSPGSPPPNAPTSVVPGAEGQPERWEQLTMASFVLDPDDIAADLTRSVAAMPPPDLAPMDSCIAIVEPAADGLEATFVGAGNSQHLQVVLRSPDAAVWIDAYRALLGCGEHEDVGYLVDTVARDLGLVAGADDALAVDLTRVEVGNPANRFVIRIVLARYDDVVIALVVAGPPTPNGAPDLNDVEILADLIERSASLGGLIQN